MQQKEDSFFELIYKAVRQIPRGRVASYGKIAALAGKPRAARAVGWALHVNPDPENIPCHRVVTKNGEMASGFAFGGPQVQASLLKEEGVGLSDNLTVDMKVYSI